MNEKIVIGLVGLVVGIFISPLFFNMWGSGGFGWGHMMNWKQSDSITEHSMMDSEYLDARFIEQMIPHHDDAIAMAEIALTRAEHEEIKTLAENIKRSQTEENKMMREWYMTWFKKDVPDITGMMGHGMMMGGLTDLSELESSGQFDKTFIEQMIPHHQMALMMTSMMLGGTERPEMRQLAEDIVKAQSQEIEQMQSWYQQWYP